MTKGEAMVVILRIINDYFEKNDKPVLMKNIKEKEFFTDGHKDGLWEKFDVHGTVVQTESYQNGKWIITTIN